MSSGVPGDIRQLLSRKGKRIAETPPAAEPEPKHLAFIEVETPHADQAAGPVREEVGAAADAHPEDAETVVEEEDVPASVLWNTAL